MTTNTRITVGMRDRETGRKVIWPSRAPDIHDQAQLESMRRAIAHTFRGDEVVLIGIPGGKK